jgi:hypothetical protein
VAAKGPTNLKRYVRAVSKFVLLTFIGPAIAYDSYGAPAPNIEVYLDRLVKAYPDWIASRDNDYVVLKNGTNLRFPITEPTNHSRTFSSTRTLTTCSTLPTRREAYQNSRPKTLIPAG